MCCILCFERSKFKNDKKNTHKHTHRLAKKDRVNCDDAMNERSEGGE